MLQIGLSVKNQNIMAKSVDPDETPRYENFGIHEITGMKEIQYLCQNILGKSIYLIPFITKTRLFKYIENFITKK